MTGVIGFSPRMSPARLGLIIGITFGAWNLLWTWLRPLADDSIPALLAFYGPMFFVWGVASYFAAGPSGSIRRGVLTGIVASFTTFCVLDLMVIARANIFLHELAGRPDWRALVDRFHGSGFDSFRMYINWHYITQAPMKIMVATLIGTGVGAIGGVLAAARHRQTICTSQPPGR